MKQKIAILFGSVRTEREGMKAVKFLQNVFEQRGHEVSVIDPLEYQLPLLDKMYKELGDGAPTVMKKLAKELKTADAYIVVSAEYNHSIPPALSNLLDHYMEEYFWKPSAIVCYSAGGFGGVRAAMQLRAMLPELGMPCIPSIFAISKIQDSFDENGTDLTGDYVKRIDRFAEELEWYSAALKEKRTQGVPY